MKEKRIVDLVGNTPLVKVWKEANIYAKLEYLNPSGSVKDRAANRILDEAVRLGKLKKNMRIVEATSGNMGISLALVGKQLGYEVTIIMPESMSDERKAMIRSLGAELILTPAQESIAGAVNYLKDNFSANESIFLPQQFSNENNMWAHYYGTAKEIYEQMDENIDIFISGIGSGGTITGIAKFLKSKNREVKIIAVEPEGVSALMGDGPKEHAIQGIGDGFIPDILQVDLVDEIVTVSDDLAISKMKDLVGKSGLMCGISSGANIAVAEMMSKKYGPNYNIVTLLPDRFERYMSVI